jgi:hypothetical protein
MSDAERKTAALMRMLTSCSDGEIVATVYAWRRITSENGLDIHTAANRVEQSNGASKTLNAAQMQKIYDKGYSKGFEDGREQGRRSVILAGAASVQRVYGSVGPGINGYTWQQIGEHCAANKHLFIGRDFEFVESIAEQLQYRSAPTEAQAKWLGDLFRRKFGGKIT